MFPFITIGYIFRPSLVLCLHEILLRSCFALMAPWWPSWLDCHHSTKQTFPPIRDWIEWCDLGLVQHGATGLSVLIDSDTEALILFPDQRRRGRPPFLASFYYIQPSFPFSVGFWAGCHHSCRRVEISWLPLKHIVWDYCTLCHLKKDHKHNFFRVYHLCYGTETDCWVV